MLRRTKVLLTAAVTSAVVVGGVGTAYAAHFQDRALPGSTVGGVSVSGLTRDEVAAVVRENASGVTVTLQTPAGERTEHLADLGYGVDVDATVDAVFAANGTWLSYATSLVAARGVDAVVHTDPQRTDLVAADLVSGAGRVGRGRRCRALEGQALLRGRACGDGAGGRAGQLPGRRVRLGARAPLGLRRGELRRRRTGLRSRTHEGTPATADTRLAGWGPAGR